MSHHPLKRLRLSQRDGSLSQETEDKPGNGTIVSERMEEQIIDYHGTLYPLWILGLLHWISLISLSLSIGSAFCPESKEDSGFTPLSVYDDSNFLYDLHPGPPYPFAQRNLDLLIMESSFLLTLGEEVNAS